MPNWCSTDIEIIGPTAEMKKLAAIVNSNDEPGFLQTICPGPEDWDYNWSVENWGTKWDMETENFKLSEDGTKITGWSDSAWAPPLEAFQTYITKNHDVSIRCSYFEGGCDFAGIWHDGVDECILPSDYKSGDFLDADRDTLLGQLDEDFGVGESLAWYEEDEAEQNRRDEKNGLFAEHSDVAN